MKATFAAYYGRELQKTRSENSKIWVCQRLPKRPATQIGSLKILVVKLHVTCLDWFKLQKTNIIAGHDQMISKKGDHGQFLLKSFLFPDALHVV
jgi:hypothetical protein